MNKSSDRSRSYIEVPAKRFLLLFNGEILVYLPADHEEAVGYFADSAAQYFWVNDRLLRIAPNLVLHISREKNAPIVALKYAGNDIDDRHFLSFFGAPIRPLLLLNLAEKNPRFSALDYSLIAHGLLDRGNEANLAPLPKAMATVLLGGYIQIDTGRALANLCLEVIVLCETSDAFLVAQTPEFLLSDGLEVEGIEVVEKKRKDISLAYTVFPATYNEGTNVGKEMESVRRATVIFRTNATRADSDTVEERKTNVMVVAETYTHYQLLFTSNFAKLHPELCTEWLSKTDDNNSVEFE